MRGRLAETSWHHSRPDRPPDAERGAAHDAPLSFRILGARCPYRAYCQPLADGCCTSRSFDTTAASFDATG